MRIELPLPFPVGTVNAFLLRGEPVTLVDAGLRTPEALAALEAALARERLRVEDVELLLLTHHHIDHAGLAAEIRERSGCEVAAHAITADLLRDVPAARAAQDAWAVALLELHGAPPEVVATVAEVSAETASMCESVEVDRRLAEGDVVRGLRVLLREGHSRADVLFVADDGTAIVGDHLLAGPSVALSERPDDADPRRRPPALLAYRASLEATAALGLATAYGGHGPPVEAPAEAVGERLAGQDRRAASFARRLVDGPRTAWQLIEERRAGRLPSGDRHPVSEEFVVLADVLAHLDLLVADGRARELVRDDGCIAYEASP